MKKILFILTITFISCNNNNFKKYEDITGNLKYNYVRDEKLVKSMTYCLGYQMHRFKDDVSNYNKGLKEFYNSDIEIIHYLLKFENDTLKYNNWISNRDPCSAKIELNDMINNSIGSLILIDNYLLNERQDTIVVRPYIRRLNHEIIKQIFVENSITKTKKNYFTYIQRLK